MQEQIVRARDLTCSLPLLSPNQSRDASLRVSYTHLHHLHLTSSSLIMHKHVYDLFEMISG